MAIKPLQDYHPVRHLPETGVTGRSRTTSSFDAVLDAAAGSGNAPLKNERAAAELLRIQMMQSTLALSGEPEGSPPSGIQALESLLAGVPRPAHERLPWQVQPQGVSVPACAPQAASELEPEGGWTDAGGVGETASRYLGTPYRFGGEGADGIDCSSFVQQVFQEHRIELPRTAREQIRVGIDVAEQDLRKGDLVFFQTYASYPSHVGIYLGDGKMIHASSGKGEVTISDMNSEYYRSRYLGAKRIA